MKISKLFITRILFFMILAINPTLYAVEINELDEITMHVLDIDSQSEIDIQQMVKIPVPTNNGLPAQIQPKLSAKPGLSSRSMPDSNESNPIIKNE